MGNLDTRDNFDPGEEVRIEAGGAAFSPGDLTRLWIVLSPRYTDNVLLVRKDDFGKWTATLNVRRENLRHTTLLDMLACISDEDDEDSAGRPSSSFVELLSGPSDATRHEHQLHQLHQLHQTSLMGPGKYVLMSHKAWEVLELNVNGDVHIKNPDNPLESKWVDYYLVEIIDPHRTPEALLETLAHILEDDVEPPEEEGAHVETAPELF